MVWISRVSGIASTGPVRVGQETIGRDGHKGAQQFGNKVRACPCGAIPIDQQSVLPLSWPGCELAGAAPLRKRRVMVEITQRLWRPLRAHRLRRCQSRILQSSQNERAPAKTRGDGTGRAEVADSDNCNLPEYMLHHTHEAAISIATPWPCGCHVIAHVIAMSMPCHCHVIATSLP